MSSKAVVEEVARLLQSAALDAAAEMLAYNKQAARLHLLTELCEESQLDIVVDVLKKNGLITVIGNQVVIHLDKYDVDDNVFRAPGGMA